MWQVPSVTLNPIKWQNPCSKGHSWGYYSLLIKPGFCLTVSMPLTSPLLPVREYLCSWVPIYELILSCTRCWGWWTCQNGHDLALCLPSGHCWPGLGWWGRSSGESESCRDTRSPVPSALSWTLPCLPTQALLNLLGKKICKTKRQQTGSVQEGAFEIRGVSEFHRYTLWTIYKLYLLALGRIQSKART